MAEMSPTDAVYVYNGGSADHVAMWDGVEYVIPKGGYHPFQRGVANVVAKHGEGLEVKEAADVAIGGKEEPKEEEPKKKKPGRPKKKKEEAAE